MNPSFKIVTEDVETKVVTKRVTGVTLTLDSKQLTFLRDIFGMTAEDMVKNVVRHSQNRSKISEADKGSKDLCYSTGLLIGQAYEDMKCAESRQDELPGVPE
jgi:hypothetical protein